MPAVFVTEERNRDRARWSAQGFHRGTQPDPADEHRAPLWGAPRIYGELLKPGIEVARSTAAKNMANVGHQTISLVRVLPESTSNRIFDTHWPVFTAKGLEWAGGYPTPSTLAIGSTKRSGSNPRPTNQDLRSARGRGRERGRRASARRSTRTTLGS